jgi:peptidoglycan/xylan/chitin deacetylase (PgdA/CDA1 family)
VSRPHPPIPILMYHNIDEPAGTRLRRLYVRPAVFSRQMTFLRGLGYRGLSMSELHPYLLGEVQGRVVGITFDDGYSDNLRNALPVLLRCGFTATCYAVSGASDGFNVWDAADLGVRKAVMTEAEMRRWLAAGMEIGAHTRTHPHLTTCDEECLAAEIGGSREDLEARLDSKVEHFCYPYGDFDDRVRTAVERAGFLTATTTRRGRAQDDDLMNLPRVHVLHTDGIARLALKTLTGYEERRGRELSR